MHRVTLPAGHNPALTGLRGVAALWVALYHGWQAFGAPRLSIAGFDGAAWLAAGYVGVDLFFVLSGFLLGLPLARALQERGAAQALRTFWWRRCLRVLPAYWAQIAVLLGVLAWQGAWPEPSALSIGSHLLLATNLVPFQVALLNPVYWSLPVEWNFYIILPLLIWAIARLRWPLALACVLFVAVCYRLACLDTVFDVPPESLLSWWAGSIHQLPARLDQFVLGMAAAALVGRGWGGGKLGDRWLVGAMLGLLAYTAWIGTRGDIYSRVELPWVLLQFTVLALLFAALCVAAGGDSAWARRLLSPRPLVYLGTISYSLYLWHLPILHWQQAWDLGERLGTPGAVLAIAALIIVVSSLSYRWFEQPFIAWAHQRRRPHGQRAESA